MNRSRDSARPALSARSNILGRWLHFGIALCVLFCLLLSLVMTPHTADISLGSIAFTLHKFIGLNCLVLVSLYFVWSLRGYAKKPSELFPWFFPARLRALKNELLSGPTHFKEWRLIPAAVQGLGLLLIVSVNVLGLLLVINIIFPTVMSAGGANAVTLTHNFFAKLVWWYLAAHVGAFLLHCWMRERRYLQMFDLLTPGPTQRKTKTNVIEAHDQFKREVQG